MSRYEGLFDTLLSLCKSNEASLILAGDWFHKAEPDLEEIQLTMQFFRRCKDSNIEVYIIAGNHESIAPKVNTLQFLDMGKDKTINVHFNDVGTLDILDEATSIYFLSHSHLPKSSNATELFQFYAGHTNILISHFRCNVNQFIKEEVNVDLLSMPFDLVIAGDIHQSFETGKVIYTNQPLNSIFEKKSDTSVILLSVCAGKFAVKRIKTELPSLIQINCTCEEYAGLKLNGTDYYRVEVTGTLPELRLIQAQPNVKVVKQPLVDVVLTAQEDEVTETHEEQKIELGLTKYLNDLNYSDSKISRLMEVWSEP